MWTFIYLFLKFDSPRRSHHRHQRNCWFICFQWMGKPDKISTYLDKDCKKKCIMYSPTFYYGNSQILMSYSEYFTLILFLVFIIIKIFCFYVIYTFFYVINILRGFYKCFWCGSYCPLIEIKWSILSGYIVITSGTWNKDMLKKISSLLLLESQFEVLEIRPCLK